MPEAANAEAWDCKKGEADKERPLPRLKKREKLLGRAATSACLTALTTVAKKTGDSTSEEPVWDKVETFCEWGTSDETTVEAAVTAVKTRTSPARIS